MASSSRHAFTCCHEGNEPAVGRSTKGEGGSKGRGGRRPDVARGFDAPRITERVFRQFVAPQSVQVTSEEGEA